MRALGSPKIPRTVPSGRKPGNAYASQSRRFRFAGAGIQNLRILSTPPHAQNPAMMRLYEVLTPEITHTTFQKTQKKEVRGGALLTTVRSYNPHNARGALSLLYLAGSFPGDFRTPACPGPGSLVVSHPPVSETLVWGDFCQGGAPRVLSTFSSLCFFVRPGSPFLRPDPHVQRTGARRSGQGWRVSATEGSSLTASSTAAHLLWSG